MKPIKYFILAGNCWQEIDKQDYNFANDCLNFKKTKLYNKNLEFAGIGIFKTN